MKTQTTNKSIYINFAVKLYFFSFHVLEMQENSLSFANWWDKFKNDLMNDVELQRKVIHLNKIYDFNKQRLDIFEINNLYILGLASEDRLT